MATVTNERYTQNNNVNPFKSIAPKRLIVGRLNPTNPVKTLIAGTPMAFDTGNPGWVAWTDGGANETGIIKAFIPDGSDVTTDLVDDDVVTLMVAGRIAEEAVVLPAGEAQPALDAALKDDLLGRGLLVSRLEDAH